MARRKTAAAEAAAADRSDGKEGSPPSLLTAIAASGQPSGASPQMARGKYANEEWYKADRTCAPCRYVYDVAYGDDHPGRR